MSFGWERIIWLDYNKNGFTFYRKADGKAVRVYVQGGAVPPDTEEAVAIAAKVSAGTATAADIKRADELKLDRAKAILKVPEDKLLKIQKLTGFKPPKAAVLGKSVTCDVCGESTDETHIRRLNGKNMCLPDYEDALSKM